MKNKRFVEDAEPYKLYYAHNSNTICVGDGLPDVHKKIILLQALLMYLIY